MPFANGPPKAKYMFLAICILPKDRLYAPEKDMVISSRNKWLERRNPDTTVVGHYSHFMVAKIVSQCSKFHLFVMFT